MSGFLPAVSRVPGLWSPGASPSPSFVLSATGCSPALRTCRGCPWRLTTLVPQGLSLSVSLPVALAVSIALGSQRIFCPLSPAVCALGCLMSRGDELRQLAAQLSVCRVAAICRRLWTLCTLCSGLRGPSCHGVCVQLRRRMERTPRRTRPRPISWWLWEQRLDWFESSPEYRNLDRIDGEPMEFEWNIFPRIEYVAAQSRSSSVIVEIE